MKLKKMEEKHQKINPMKTLKEKRSSLANLESDLEKEGVDFFISGESLNIDSDYLKLPANITDVSNRELGEMLNAFTQQKVYMRTLLGHAELYCEQARREYMLASQPLYTKYSGLKMAEKSKDREVMMDSSVYPLYEEYSNRQMRCQLLQHNIDDIVDIIFMISREVSRRNSDFDNENRNYNVNK